MKFDGQRYATNDIDAPIVDPILERGGPKAQLCRGFQNMKFDGQRYTTIEIDDPIVDPILERGDLKAELCRGRRGAQLRRG